MQRFFFFQAEDGIRDLTVTGVQTCALPISRGFLKIREHGGVYDIERTGKDVEWLPGEKPISDMLPAPGRPVTIGKEYSPGGQRTRELCERMLALHFGEQFFSRNLGSLITCPGT